MIRLLIRLYPEWWRRRYGQELQALLEDSGTRWYDAWDLLRGAMQMQMKIWSFGRIVTVCGIAGLVLAGVVAITIPYAYRSTAVLKISEGDRPAVSVVDMVNEVAATALARKSLEGIIATQSLYLQERKTMPMEDVIDKVMHRDIQITPVLLGAGDKAIKGIVVNFAYSDPSKTQQVTQVLVEEFSGFQVLDPPSAPEHAIKPRSTLTGLGLIAGLLFGTVLAMILRRRAALAN